MAALKRLNMAAEITWLGHVPDRDADLRAMPAPGLTLGFAGPKGEAHGGLTRPSCSRVSALYPRGTEIANTRQLSILSAEELYAIATEMGLPTLDPALLGASMVVRGWPDFSHIPPGSRLQAQGGTTLVVDMENRPCHLPGPLIEAAHPGFGALFRKAAQGRRGVTAWVERPGTLNTGDTLALFIPDQPVWARLDVARQGAAG
jgi:hypothetical protein